MTSAFTLAGAIVALHLGGLSAYAATASREGSIALPAGAAAVLNVDDDDDDRRRGRGRRYFDDEDFYDDDDDDD